MKRCVCICKATYHRTSIDTCTHACALALALIFALSPSLPLPTTFSLSRTRSLSRSPSLSLSRARPLFHALSLSLSLARPASKVVDSSQKRGAQAKPRRRHQVEVCCSVLQCGCSVLQCGCSVFAAVTDDVAVISYKCVAVCCVWFLCASDNPRPSSIVLQCVAVCQAKPCRHQWVDILTVSLLLN